jgi:transposase-like protein
MAKDTKKHTVKKLFIEGKTISFIATALGISRATIYVYKKEDFENGIDWDELSFAQAIDPSGTKLNEKEFLATLIRQFEEALKDLDKLEDPSDKLNLLNEYAKSYYRLKAPLKNDCKSAVLEASSKTIYTISQLALENDAKETLTFLSQNSDKIIEAVLKK